MVYRALAAVLSPLLWWGRARVEGLESVPRTGPLLLVPNHDSQMDPVLVGLALRRVRQVRTLGRANLWRIPGLAPLFTAVGGIPIERGAGDGAALARAVAALRGGEAVCIFPEGRLSRGTALRARTGVARLWRAAPETRVVACAITGSTDYVRYPRRPRVTIRFFEPSGGQPRLGEELQALATRLLGDVRALAPNVDAGRRRERPLPQESPAAGR